MRDSFPERLDDFQQRCDEFFATPVGFGVYLVLAAISAASLVAAWMLRGTAGEIWMSVIASLVGMTAMQAAVHGARPLLGRLLIALGVLLLCFVLGAISISEIAPTMASAGPKALLLLTIGLTWGLLAVSIPFAALGALVEGRTDHPLALDAEDLDGGDTPW